MKTLDIPFNDKKFGWLVMAIGLLQLCWYYVHAFVISHFTDLWIREWFWPFLMSPVIMIAGLFIMKKVDKVGLIILSNYFVFLLFDRITVPIFFRNYTSFGEVCFPILLALPILWGLKKTETNIFFKGHYAWFYLIFIWLAIFPKIVY
ncbi:MAG: hypothetical protein AAF705_21455 [Bacteroidota bacterium]